MTQPYYSTIIIPAIISAYAFTYAFAALGKITIITHRKIWNAALLAVFVLSGLGGIILTLLLDFRLVASWYSFLLWLHVEAGIMMAVIGLFHAFWHLAYYQAVIKNVWK